MNFISGMQAALEEAKKCAEKNIDVPVGCAIYKDGTLLAVASNTRQQDGDIAGHAEIKAMKTAGKILGDWRLEGCTMFVTLEPCPMCAGAIKDARISTLVYGASRPDNSCHSILPEDIKIFPGICKEESGELLKAFFRNRR